MANPTATQVLALMARDIGKTENPPGSNRGPVTGWNETYPRWAGSPWCQAKCHAVMLTAGFPAVALPGGGRAAFGGPAPFHTTMSLAAAKAGRLGAFKYSGTPKVGDLVVYRFSHVGILERIRPDGQLVVLEGNTSPTNASSQANGGGVYRRTRSRSLVAGYIRPPYGAGAPAKPPALRLPLALDGDLGPQTKLAWQRYQKRAETGVWTRDDVRSLQTWVGNPRTGVLTRHDVRDIETKLGFLQRTGRLTPDRVQAFQRFLNRRLTGKAS